MKMLRAVSPRIWFKAFPRLMRTMRRHGLGFSEADRLLGYRPRGAVFCLLYKMIRSKCPFAIAEKAYLAVRKAYVLTV